MKCPRCQHDNETGAKFCEDCATPLARPCAPVRSLTVCDGEVLPGVCAPDGAVCRAVSGSAIRLP
jgi:hypothetical protein